MELIRPRTSDGQWVASDRTATVEVRFAGLGSADGRSGVLAAVGGGGLELAWCRQVHSDRSVEAHPGECGEADALITDRAGLALAVATADCVPVVLAGRRRLAVIHAGWRGIASAIVPKTLERLDSSAPPIAWLGPAIGACCYEVGHDVAEAVISASGPEAVAGAGAASPPGKPHLDLHRAVTRQLEQWGVSDVRRVDACTRCRSDALSSYRREGPRAGRNLAFAWLKP